MNDVVIVESVRSACGRYKKGGLAATRAEDMGIQVIKALLARVPAVMHGEVNDVIAGCAFPEGEQGLNLGRVLALGAGLPVTVAGVTVNRFCSSGLQAIADTAATIGAGWAEVVIAGGCESMSHVPLGGNLLRPHPDWGDLPNTYVTMGITAENIAAAYHVSREDQDIFSVESHSRAHEAVKTGRFSEEIVPLEASRYKTAKSGKRIREKVRFEVDDGIRWPAGAEELAKLSSPFRRGGSVTAGNSSQMSDGAAFSLLMSARKAAALGIKPLARLACYAVVGCRPEEMGVGPALAIPKVLAMAGLKMKDIDVFEINEAFAAQAIYCLRALNIEDRWRMGDVNPNGGAIALGHPLGATGAKLTAQLLYELKRRQAGRGIVAMCVGGGMGAAGIFEMIP